MGLDNITLAAAKSYVKQSMQGAGAVKGQKGDPGLPGKDGVSPIITTTSITGGHKITITDKNGTQSFDVMDGEEGTSGSSLPIPIIKDKTFRSKQDMIDAGVVNGTNYLINCNIKIGEDQLAWFNNEFVEIG